MMKRIEVPCSRVTLMRSAALVFTFCFGLLGLVHAAPLAEASTPPGPSLNLTSAGSPPSAKKCMSDLRLLDGQMQSDGNWVHGSGFGYGYPLYGYGYEYGLGGYGALIGHGDALTSSHSRTRPGYELRTLIASATVLAQRGKQQECDALLTVAREVYKDYAADLRASKAPKKDGSAMRRQQIEAALPVAHSKGPYRSDQLIGADVVNPQGDDLGDVYDVVLNAQIAGKIEYLVVGRGGVFGIGERHIPVPWEAFKMTADGNVMVLDISKTNLDTAPRVAENHFYPSGNVGDRGQSADAFWKTRILK